MRKLPSSGVNSVLGAQPHGMVSQNHFLTRIGRRLRHFRQVRKQPLETVVVLVLARFDKAGTVRRD
jgi:hypothetical protein